MAQTLPNTTEDSGARYVSAVDGLFEAFETYPLVGLGDDHGVAQGMDFYADLVRDPRFAREVGNIVVEFGASRQQDVVDRYVDAQSVPYTELRSVWTDTVGWTPTAGYLGFVEFLATVRSVNKSLPTDKRIKVWLGEPPVDWDAPSREQLMAAMSSRDSFPAALIASNILANGKKALVIYGSFHFARGPSLRGRIEAEHPDAMFVILPYANTHRPAPCQPFAASAAHLSTDPVLATSRGNREPSASFRDCLHMASQSSGVVGRPLEVDGDAVLFYGPLEQLTQGPFLPDYVLDAEYRREIARRSSLGGPPLVRLPVGYELRKADYSVDLDAPGFGTLIDLMFATYDMNGDGVVTSQEYVDPIP